MTFENQANFESWKDALIVGNVEDAILHYDSNLTKACVGSKQFALIERDLLVDMYAHYRNGLFPKSKFVYLGTNSYVHTGWFSAVSNITQRLEKDLDQNSSIKEGVEDIEIHFSYVWQKIEGRWHIVHYHLSFRNYVAKNEVADNRSSRCLFLGNQSRHSLQV